MASISPQGYSYGKDPKATNPFWDDKEVVFPEVSATASVDDTTGTPEVEVTKTGDDSAPVLNFAFSGIKGEKGADGKDGAAGPAGPRGEKGEMGATPDINASAKVGTSTAGDVTPSCTVTKTKTETGYIFQYQFNGIIGAQGAKGDQGPQGEQGPAPYISADATVDNTTGDPRVAVTTTESEDGKSFTYHFNFRGIKGEPGENGKDGETPTEYVKDLTITLVDNTLNFAITKGDGEVTQFPVTLSGSGSENGIVEVKDTVTQNKAYAFDHHVFTETQDDGTENTIGEFYIARKQTVDISQSHSSIEVTTVSQSGVLETRSLPILSFYREDSDTRAFTISGSIDTSKPYILRTKMGEVIATGILLHDGIAMKGNATGGMMRGNDVIFTNTEGTINDGEDTISLRYNSAGIMSTPYYGYPEVRLFSIDGTEIPITQT